MRGRKEACDGETAISEHKERKEKQKNNQPTNTTNKLHKDFRIEKIIFEIKICWMVLTTGWREQRKATAG